MPGRKESGIHAECKVHAEGARELFQAGDMSGMEKVSRHASSSRWRFRDLEVQNLACSVLFGVCMPPISAIPPPSRP